MSLCYAVIFLLLFTKEISNNSMTSQPDGMNSTYSAHLKAQSYPAHDTAQNYPNGGAVHSYPSGYKNLISDKGVPSVGYPDKVYASEVGYPDNSTNSLQYRVGYGGNIWGDGISDLDMNRRKRSAVQLYSMVSCSTGCDPLSYKGYGCYCGFLGSGYPVDPIDRCCELHDWCYTGSKCPLFLEYFIPYVWTCFRGRPLCQRGKSCSHRLCECDRRFSECLRPYSCPRYKAVCRSNVFRLMQNLLLV